MSFNKRLQDLLDERDLTQKEVANALNISPSTFGGYVQGKREPDFATLVQLARYFNVSTDYFLDYDGGNTKAPGEKEIVQIYRSLSSEQRALYREVGRAFLRFSKEA